MSKLPVNNLIRHPALVALRQREAANGHKAAVIWFTGLPGSGKSTTAHAVEQQLFDAGCQTYVLDGDNVRHGLSADLGFSPADREEHMRRVGELAKLLYEAGMIVLCAFISPTRTGRAKVRKLIPAHCFFEVHCKCPVEVCENRDPKGFVRAPKREKSPNTPAYRHHTKRPSTQNLYSIPQAILPAVARKAWCKCSQRVV